jgi:hypothetical protein
MGKTKLSLSLINHSAGRDDWGRGGIIPVIHTSVAMEISDELHNPAALPGGREDLVLVRREVGWTESVWMRRRRDKRLLVPGMEPR